MQEQVKFHNENEIDKYVNKLLLFAKIYTIKYDADVEKLSHENKTNVVKMICEMAYSLSVDDLKKVILKLKELLNFAQQDISNGRLSSAYINECYDTKLACLKVLTICHNVLVDKSEMENIK